MYETSRRAWVSLNSKMLLANKITSLQMFETRLKYLWTRGYRRLPTAEKLVKAYGQIANSILLSLYQLKEAELNTLLAPLMAQYSVDSDSTTRGFDITLDFYGLIVFCVLRRYTFEEVYLECTDRCPLFL